MTYAVEIVDGVGSELDHSALVRAVATTLEHEAAHKGAGVTVQLVDDDAQQALNAAYRGVAAPTDVLSFPAEHPPIPHTHVIDDERASVMLYLGDLSVAVPYTQAQARRLGHDLTQSVMLLAVHGTLHLLGYTHQEAQDRAQMWAAQASVLATLGVPLSLVPSLEDTPPDHD